MNTFYTARTVQKDVVQFATSRHLELLSLILDRQMQSGLPVPALKFRAEHYADREALDALEKQQLLRRTNEQYRITGLALPMLRSDIARQLLLSVERVFALLRAHYIEHQTAQAEISMLTDKAQLSASEMVRIMDFLRDGGLWYGGGSIDLRVESAYVCCREPILDFDSFELLVAEVMSWAPELPQAVSLRVPRLPEAASSSVLAANAVDMEEPGDFVLAWQAVRSCLQEFKFDEIKDIAGLAGLNLPAVAHIVQGSGGATKGQLMTAFDEQVGSLEKRKKARIVTTAIEEVLRRKDELQERLSEYLSRLGWSFINNTLVPIEILNASDLAFVPVDAQKDLVKAAQRMRDGDISGAISAACGAVDAATSRVYEQLGLGDPAAASFQERCRKAAQARGMFITLEAELSQLGWQPKELVPFKKNLEGALNQGAYVLQTLRSQMGDVHGTKPITRSLAFEALKWAELIVAALVDEHSQISVS